MSAFNVVLGCVMALLVILCTISSMARYYIKFTIFIVLSLVCATVPMPLMLLKPFDPKNALFHILSVQRVRTSTGPLEPGLKGLSIVCFVIWTCFNMYSTWNILQLKAELRERGATSTGKKANLIGRIPAASLRALARLLGLSWTVRGLENVNNSKGTVVLLNHQSGIDLYALALIWPLMSRCTVVAKRSLQYLVPFGTATWLWGTVFIDRGAQTARDALNKQVEAIKDQKRKLLLFPEGTRHSGDRLLPFRKGAFHVAMDAGAPIQPVVVSKYHFLDDKRHKFGSGEFIVSILPMIETEGLSKDDIDALVEKTQKSMQEEFTKISTETLERLNHRANVD